MENRSESIVKLAEALSKAQGEIRGAIKDSENPYYHMTYASLASVWDAAREPLSKNGLAIVQITKVIEGKLMLETVLIHASGEWYSSIYPITPMKQVKNEGWTPSDDPQSMGSAISYGRRYSLASIIGIATADDDGNAATGKDTEKQKSEGKQNHPPTETITTVVTNVTATEGTKKDKTKFSKYAIHTKDKRYSTFSGTIAKVASEAKTTGQPVTIVFHTTPYGPEIISLTAHEPPEPPPINITQDTGFVPDEKAVGDIAREEVIQIPVGDIAQDTDDPWGEALEKSGIESIDRPPMSINEYRSKINSFCDPYDLNTWFRQSKPGVPSPIMPEVAKMVNDKIKSLKK